MVEGPLIVGEALAGMGQAATPWTVEGLYLEPGANPELVASAHQAGVEVHLVARGILATILDTVSPQPVAAVVTRPPWAVDAIASGLVLVVVDGRDPGNAGTLIRSAEAAGAAGVVLAGSSVDPTNPKVLRASAGAGLRLPVVVEPDVGTALSHLSAGGRRVLATVVDPAAEPYDQVDLGQAVVVLGNESHGLAPEVVAAADQPITIPLAGPTESLNLGVAGSLLCFEALRQRRRNRPQRK